MAQRPTSPVHATKRWHRTAQCVHLRPCGPVGALKRSLPTVRQAGQPGARDGRTPVPVVGRFPFLGPGGAAASRVVRALGRTFPSRGCAVRPAPEPMPPSHSALADRRLAAVLLSPVGQLRRGRVCRSSSPAGPAFPPRLGTKMPKCRGSGPGRPSRAPLGGGRCSQPGEQCDPPGTPPRPRLGPQGPRVQHTRRARPAVGSCFELKKLLASVLFVRIYQLSSGRKRWRIPGGSRQARLCEASAPSRKPPFRGPTRRCARTRAREEGAGPGRRSPHPALPARLCLRSCPSK